MVVVLSGRQVEEVRQLVGLPGVVYLGNHGLERWEKNKKCVEPRAFQYTSAIRNILGQARQELKLPGLLFEDKGTTASIHYRSAQDLVAARKRIVSLLRDLAREPGLKVLCRWTKAAVSKREPVAVVVASAKERADQKGVGDAGRLDLYLREEQLFSAAGKDRCCES